MEATELVREAKNGNKEALIQLVMAEKNAYYRLAYMYLNNKEDALDAVEDMIVLLYENIRRLRKEEAFYSWSRTILVNCCKNLLRRNKKIILMDSPPAGACETDLYMKEDQVMLEEHLSQLSEKHREILKLRYYLDFDYQTIADLLKIPLGTVKSRISTGLERLKLLMEVNCGGKD